MKIFGLVIIVAAFSTGSAYADPQAANSFHELHSLLSTGKPTMVLVEASVCQSKDQPPSQAVAPTILGGFLIQGFMERVGQEIRFADQHLTVGPDGAAKIEVIQYRVGNDEEGTVKVTTLSPTTYTPVAPVREFQCRLGSGLRFVSP